MTDWSHTDPMVGERLILDAAVWRGIRNAIIPSLLFWVSFIGLGYLGWRIGEAALIWAGALI